MKYGIILGSPSIAGQIATARRAEAAGFESVWTTEFFNSNGLVRLAAVATGDRTRESSARRLLMPSCARPCWRPQRRWISMKLSAGRMVLGLGSGTERMNREWYSMPFDDPPAPRIRDAIGLVRAAIAAQKGGGLTYEGPYYQVKIPGVLPAARGTRRDPHLSGRGESGHDPSRSRGGRRSDRASGLHAQIHQRTGTARTRRHELRAVALCDHLDCRQY